MDKGQTSSYNINIFVNYCYLKSRLTVTSSRSNELGDGRWDDGSDLPGMVGEEFLRVLSGVWEGQVQFPDPSIRILREKTKK